MIPRTYTLDWLDFIITVALSTSHQQQPMLTRNQSEAIKDKIDEQKHQYFSYLNAVGLQLSGRQKLDQFVRQQHIRLLALLDLACENALAIPSESVLMVAVSDYLKSSIYELLTFLETRFNGMIPPQEIVPAAYLAETKKEIALQASHLQSLFLNQDGNQDLIGILLSTLTHFESTLPGITFAEIFYKKEMVKNLRQIGLLEEKSQIHNALIDISVYLNFNSRAFIRYYTESIARRIDDVGPIPQKIEQLLLSRKQFSQMHRRIGARFSQDEPDLAKTVDHWFSQEILYLETKQQWQMKPLPSEEQPPEPQPFKVMCFLSVDQIALILRALDSLRIIKATSMNAVFHAIAPFLSTVRRQHISWESMRSKAYTFEERDKVIAIQTLESVIKWLKEY
ncbi:hypothetical protein ACFP1I_12890 [Dyadobacter subterraneus]|uniref:Uncharacterized protein n=1 Tax=Dyadobacter subterraneus TaxID=2773304 RepID=A0ABR9W9G2_9BACT|nr:hypothetical protein [Dyadobacter subterraneus]MBE9462127.1 hypothetical protein [Dyadobacter subterraneus]